METVNEIDIEEHILLNLTMLFIDHDDFIINTRTAKQGGKIVSVTAYALGNNLVPVARATAATTEEALKELLRATSAAL
ncbi:hypothetical protein VTO58DRAFT_109428 [Aureobasidium pullulans]